MKTDRGFEEITENNTLLVEQSEFEYIKKKAEQRMQEQKNVTTFMIITSVLVPLGIGIYMFLEKKTPELVVIYDNILDLSVVVLAVLCGILFLIDLMLKKSKRN